MRHLTTKQEHFCINYLLNNNATEAAIKAGYSKNTAVVIASQNLTKLNVKNRLQELRDKTESSKVMNIRERKEVLTLIGRFGGKSSIGAIAELNKMDGAYAPIKSEIKADIEVNLDAKARLISLISHGATRIEQEGHPIKTLESGSSEPALRLDSVGTPESTPT